VEKKKRKGYEEVFAQIGWVFKFRNSNYFMAVTKKSKRPWLSNVKLQQSIWEKGAAVRHGKFPPELQHTWVRGKTVVALKALHSFKPAKMEWGAGKKQGAVQLWFAPVLGYRSVSRTETGSEHNPDFRFYQADHMFGFKDWHGFAVRFMAYPTGSEKTRHRQLYRLNEVVWPHDFVTAARMSLGYIGGTVTFAAKQILGKKGAAFERKPTFFLQAIEIRPSYRDIVSTKYVKEAEEVKQRREIKRRFEGWYKRWAAEIERQCKEAGFERVAWITSSDPFFSSGKVKIKPETRQALYKTAPEKMGYKPEKLLVPTVDGLREVTYYCKGLKEKVE